MLPTSARPISSRYAVADGKRKMAVRGRILACSFLFFVEEESRVTRPAVCKKSRSGGATSDDLSKLAAKQLRWGVVWSKKYARFGVRM